MNSNKFMSKVISMFLICSFFISSFSYTASATSLTATSNYNAFEFNGTYYASYEDKEYLANMAAYPNGTIEVAIRNWDEENYFYSVVLNSSQLTTSNTTINYLSDDLWDEALDVAKQKMSSDTRIYIPSVVEVDTSVPVSRSYLGSSFEDCMEELYGSEYTGKLIDSISQSPQRKVTEDMTFLYDVSYSTTLKEAMSTVSFITSVLGLVSRNEIIATIGTVTGIVSYILPEGTKIAYYTCSVEYDRDGWCDGKRYVYYSRTISHDGFRGDEGYSIVEEPSWDMADNYFYNTEFLMEGAYNCWYLENN